MRYTSPTLNPDAWFRHLFSSKSARDGGVVRRKTKDMERMVGRSRFYAEISRRGFSAVENDGQVIVFCNASPVRARILSGQTLTESLRSEFL